MKGREYEDDQRGGNRPDHSCRLSQLQSSVYITLQSCQAHELSTLFRAWLGEMTDCSPSGERWWHQITGHSLRNGGRQNNAEHKCNPRTCWQMDDKDQKIEENRNFHENIFWKLDLWLKWMPFVDLQIVGVCTRG